jgi:hypothetical protein
MYESTVDVLYNLYDKLSVGGYVIVDDVSALPVFPLETVSCSLRLFTFVIVGKGIRDCIPIKVSV